MGKLSIAQFLDDLARDYEARAHRRKHAEQEAENRIAELREKDKALSKEIEETLDLRHRLEKSGYDTEAPAKTLADLEQRRTTLEIQLAAAAADREATSSLEGDAVLRCSPLGTMQHRDDLSGLKRHLESHGCSDAYEFDTVADLWRHLPITLESVDADGRPTSVRVHVGARSFVDFAIQPTSRVCRSFVPNELGWLEEAAARFLPSGNADDPPLVAFVRETGTRFASTCRFSLFHESSSTWGQTQRQEDKYDVSYLLRSLHNEVESLRASLASLPLTAPLPEGTLAQTMQERVLALTSAVPRFRRNSSKATSSSIASKIALPWRAFVEAPWHGGLRGPLAKLKYLAENGETPRFWDENFEGHIGLRLRTRDHTWLVGEVFLPDPMAAPGTLIEVLGNDYGKARARMGQVLIRVSECND